MGASLRQISGDRCSHWHWFPFPQEGNMPLSPSIGPSPPRYYCSSPFGLQSQTNLFLALRLIYTLNDTLPLVWYQQPYGFLLASLHQGQLQLLPEFGLQVILASCSPLSQGIPRFPSNSWFLLAELLVQHLTN